MASRVLFHRKIPPFLKKPWKGGFPGYLEYCFGVVVCCEILKNLGVFKWNAKNLLS